MSQYPHNGFNCECAKKWQLESFRIKKFKFICLWSQKIETLVELCVRDDYAFNICGLLVLLIQKSSPFSFWACDLSVSLSTPMLQSPWLSLTGRRNGGVWGKWWRLCIPTHDSYSAHCIIFVPAIFSDALHLCSFL